MENLKFCHQRDFAGSIRENRLVWLAQTPASPEQVKAQIGDAPWVLNGLNDSLMTWKKEREASQDPVLRKTLDLRVSKGQRYLDKLQEALESPEQLEDGLDEWGRLAFLSEFLANPQSTHEGLAEVLDTDLEAFLDPDTLSKVTVAHVMVEQNKVFQGVLRPNPIDDFATILDKQWEFARRSIEEMVLKLANPETKLWYLQDLAKNAESDKQEWIKKNLRKAEMDEKKPTFTSDLVPMESLEKIQKVDSQSRILLQEMMAERLERRLDHVKAEADQMIQKWEPELCAETPSRLRKSLDCAGERIHARIRSFQMGNLSPADAQDALKKWMDEFEAESVTAVREIHDLDAKLILFSKNKAEILARVTRKAKKVREFMDKASSDGSIEAFAKAIEDEKRLLGTSDDTIREGQIIDGRKFAEDARNPASDMGKEIIELRETLADPQPVESLRAEEVLAMENDVDGFYGKIVNSEKSGMARSALDSIASGGSVENILSKLGDHVEYATTELFRTRYQAYTPEGFMVFVIRGDEWKIVVDQGRLRDSPNLDAFKTQLTHELRHLEFEGDPRLHLAWERAFLERLSKENWDQVKGAFVSRDSSKKPSGYLGEKTAFVPDDWQDADVLSELYAMSPDWSFMSPETLSVAQRATRLAEFDTDPALRESWTDRASDEKNREPWNHVRDAFESAFPHLRSSDGLTVGMWRDEDILSELYALGEGVANHPELSTALAALGLRSLGSKPQDKAERVLGFSGGGGGEKGKDSEAAEDADAPKTREQLQGDLKSIQDSVDSYRKSPYLRYYGGGSALLSRISSIAHSLEDDLKGDTPDLGDIQRRAKILEECLNGPSDSIKSRLTSISEKSTNPVTNPISAFWRSFSVYSLADFKAVFDHGKDYFLRWAKKRAGIYKGNLSKLIFDGINEGLTLESSSFISGAWKDAVLGWEERLKSKDPGKLYGYMKEQAESGHPDKGVVLAIINVLCDKGAMDWTNKNVWICLNGLQTVTKLDPNDKLLLEDETYLREKLKKVLGAPPVYNKMAAFNDHDRTNSNAYETKKNEYKSVIMGAPGQIGKRLNEMLIKRKGKKLEEKSDRSVAVDPAEYEMMIELAIENGLYSPQSAMFYLISGMACGLLKPNTGIKLAKLWNTYPVMAYFSAMAGEFNTTKKIRKFVEKNFEQEYLNCEISSGESKFRNFYWTQMANHSWVFRRITKTAKPGGGAWDHDWSEAFAMCGDSSVFKTILQKSSSAVTEKTMPPNIYAGFLQWFELNKSPDRKTLADRIGSYFAFKSIMSGAAYANEKGFVRDSSIRMEIPAGEASSTNHPNESTSWVDSRLSAIMMSHPNPILGALFQMAVNKQAAVSDPDGHLANIKRLLAGAVPESDLNNLVKLDDFYDDVGKIVATLIG